MFGVAEDILLDGLVGRTCERLSVGAGLVELNFDGGWKLTIESGWVLEESAGNTISASRQALLDHADRLTALVGARVAGAVPRPPDRVEIDFGATGKLFVIDDSDVLESFSIEPIGVIV
jgi:hypothetical protein